MQSQFRGSRDHRFKSPYIFLSREPSPPFEVVASTLFEVVSFPLALMPVVSTNSSAGVQLTDMGFASTLEPGSSGIRVLIVGCGFGGLACAIESARKGHMVTILEKDDPVRTEGELYRLEYVHFTELSFRRRRRASRLLLCIPNSYI